MDRDLERELGLLNVGCKKTDKHMYNKGYALQAWLYGILEMDGQCTDTKHLFMWIVPWTTNRFLSSLPAWNESVYQHDTGICELNDLLSCGWPEQLPGHLG